MVIGRSEVPNIISLLLDNFLADCRDDIIALLGDGSEPPFLEAMTEVNKFRFNGILRISGEETPIALIAL